MPRLNIEAILHRKTKTKDTEVIWTRYYARIETAVRRCTEFLILEGEVGDTIEFVLRLNAWQVGTIRMTASGKMAVQWVQRKMIQEILKTSKSKTK